MIKIIKIRRRINRQNQESRMRNAPNVIGLCVITSRNRVKFLIVATVLLTACLPCFEMNSLIVTESRDPFSKLLYW